MAEFLRRMVLAEVNSNGRGFRWRPWSSTKEAWKSAQFLPSVNTTNVILGLDDVIFFHLPYRFLVTEFAFLRSC